MADTKQQWYKDAKYGLFIHWGLYSILAGEWKDPKTGEVTKTDRIAEWIENNLNIDKEDYRKLKDEFHPDKFDADMFVKRAKEQWGVKYIVLTSKHHEGFAMYDSKVSDFNVVKAAGRDILRELSDACKKYDMTMGIYYSQAQDWDDDNAYKKDYEDKNEWKPEFRTYFDEKCKPQLKELLENYDNISLIWFDTPMGMTADEAQELRDWVKGIKPDCIISGRIGHQKGDYMTTGDNFIPRLPYDGDWEVPATVNDTWGYNKYDTNWKNPDDILNLLLKIVGRGGNYLLNVGPMADGTVPEACVEVMNEVGKYVTENAEAIYGTKNVGIYPYEIPSIEFTKRPHKLYVHVLAPRYRVELLNIGNGIPWSAYQLCLYYNKDYLDQVGVDVPESWDDLVDACAKLKDAGIQPFNYSDKDNYHFEHLMSALALKAYGTSIADDLASDKEAYNGEKMVAIYQKMKDMIDAGYWGDGILSTDFNTERNMFEAGKAAFTVDGTWNCGNFQNDSDTTLFDAQKIGVTRIPYIDEANKTVEMGGGSDTYYITTLNKSDEEIAATVKFIKYLTSVDSINEMCKSSPTTYAEKVTIDTGNYLLDDVNAIMAENTESKLEIPTYDSNTAAMDTIRNSLQALATGASAQEVGDDIVDKMSAYE